MDPIGSGMIKVMKGKNRRFSIAFQSKNCNLNIYLCHIYIDDGEGHIGTVCELGRAGSTYSPEKTVIVNWDSGNRSNYRVGYQDQYDLIVVDNAQIGMPSKQVKTYV